MIPLSLPRVRPEAAPEPASLDLPLPAGMSAPDPATLAAAVTVVLRRYGVEWPVVTPATAGPGNPADLWVAAGATPAGSIWSLTAPGDGLRCDYDRAVLSGPTAARMAEHVGRVLAGGPDVDILLPAEHRWLARQNPADPGYPATTLHRLFREQAARTPEQAALVLGAELVTYRELDERSDRLARQLRPHVTEPGAAVVLSGERSTELFVAILAIFKAGGCFTYADPGLPARRVDAILRQSEPVAVLRTATAHPGTAVEGSQSVADLLALPDPGGELDDRAHEGSTAYLFFTSGSTGEPKGVLRPHRMHSARIFLEQGLYQLGPADRVLLKSPISFRESWWPMAAGATTVIAEPGRDRDDRYLAELIDSAGITTVSFVPSMLRLLIRRERFRNARALRHVFVGGEVLPADLEQQLRDCGFAVHNTYTLTEADYVCHRQGPAEPDPLDSGAGTNIGRPLDMQVYLTGPDGRLVPPGVPGEIRTGGPGLSAGYLGRPDLTAERFTANPYDPAGPATLFRTGDLARFRGDGQLEYLGRADAQVKVRGQRVEPAEVELVLREHPAIADAAVVGVADPDQGAVLAAYLVATGPEPAVRAVRTFVEQRLPDFMVPSYLALVPALPLLDSGKVDRAKLRTPSRSRPGIGTAYAPPQSADQRTAVQLVAGVLGLDSVGVDDDFFALGGDSLRLMLLRAAVEAAVGGDVDLAAVLDAGTPRALAALLRGRPEQAPPPALTGRRGALRDRQAALRERRAATPGPKGVR
ncbi:non-ribosomal peptide synthetase [Actinoplanes sp. N902-109]|uniref:non-ribosomal peptide synthetase n=1 Tax=Actinoplanes sp. (strain N902-109) TaxID=649831 RepID=UPI00032961D8|nr:non-ribosomal peptide synthetase [Actinoplanes sp. N902-109]AGL14998.1 non-ribosomal peptide synthetase [Actinoplanes sp. N902-109]